MRMLCVDYGDSRIGLATCDELEILASPLRTIKASSMRNNVDAVAAIAAEEAAARIVVGLPLNMDGSEGPRAGKTRAFGRVLARVSGLKVDYFDERLTSVEAEEILSSRGVGEKKKREVSDSVAAALILEAYLAARKNQKGDKNMENEKDNENVEIMDEDEIITLYDDDDNAIDFYEVACVEYESEFYALLEPVEPMEGLEEGDCLIFKLVEQEDGTDKFEPVMDEDLLNAVFEEYMRVAADCECDCDECAHHCDCDECEGEDDDKNA